MSRNDRELPAFTRDGHDWSASIKLRAWNRYLSKSREGLVSVTVFAPASEGELPAPPSEEQRAAIEQLVADQEKISAAVLKVLFKQYAEARADWDDDDNPLKPLKDVTELQKHVRLLRVFVLATAKQRRAYLGFEFSCRWAEEHGAGVVIHKTRIVARGGADEAFSDHAATDDGGVALEAVPPVDVEAKRVKPRAAKTSAAAKPKPRTARKK